MLDHFGFVVRDLEKAVAFYENALAPIGLKVIERHEYGAVIFARSKEDEFPFIWIGIAMPGFWNETHKPLINSIWPPWSLALSITESQLILILDTMQLTSLILMGITLRLELDLSFSFRIESSDKKTKILKSRHS
jgi:hypothetical protein